MMSNFSFRGATTFNWNNDPVAPRIEAVEISALYKGKAKQLIPTPTPVMKRPTKNTPTPRLLSNGKVTVRRLSETILWGLGGPSESG